MIFKLLHVTSRIIFTKYKSDTVTVLFKIFCGFPFCVNLLMCHAILFLICSLPVYSVSFQTPCSLFFFVWCPTHSEVLKVSWIHNGFLALSVWTYHLEDFLFCPPTKKPVHNSRKFPHMGLICICNWILCCGHYTKLALGGPDKQFVRRYY